MPGAYHDEVPTEPATSPRSQLHEVPVLPNYVEELQLPSLEYGPHPEPERFATRYILNDGSMPQEAYEELIRKAAQSFNNRDMERERHVQKLQSIKHINGVSKNGKLRSRLVAFTMLQFHAAPLQQEPRPVDASSARLPLAATPMTPSHPPRPPIEALPKYPPMDEFLCQQASIGATDSTGSAEQTCSMQGISTLFSASRSSLYGSKGNS